MLTSTSVDLTLGLATLAQGEGVTGTYRSARFSFEPTPTGPAKDLLGAQVVVLEGEASKDMLKRVFRAELTPNDVVDVHGTHGVDGCLFSEPFQVASNGSVTISISPEVWLDQAEFDDVAESIDGKPVALSRESAAFKAITRGIQKPSAYTFRYSSP
jgi:hypothetical protein